MDVTTDIHVYVAIIGNINPQQFYTNVTGYLSLKNCKKRLLYVTCNPCYNEIINRNTIKIAIHR